MGLGLAFLWDLIELKRSGALDDARRVVEIGAQQIADPLLFATKELDDLFRLFGRERPDLGQPSGASFSERAPPSLPMWTALGFDYTAIDYNGHRNSVALDLNRDGVPAQLRGSFDLVVNAGTTEHIANQDNAFRVIHDLCRIGGVMYHEVPAGGHMTHGLINYTPRFFENLSGFNVYGVSFLRVSFCGSSPVPESIRESNRRLGGGDHIQIDSVPDFMIRAAFRRQTNKPFVSPLDVDPRLLPLKDRQPFLGWRHAVARRLSVLRRFGLSLPYVQATLASSDTRRAPDSPAGLS